jgi:hypothetical protein
LLFSKTTFLVLHSTAAGTGFISPDLLHWKHSPYKNNIGAKPTITQIFLIRPLAPSKVLVAKNLCNNVQDSIQTNTSRELLTIINNFVYQETKLVTEPEHFQTRNFSTFNDVLKPETLQFKKMYYAITSVGNKYQIFKKRASAMVSRSVGGGSPLK